MKSVPILVVAGLCLLLPCPAAGQDDAVAAAPLEELAARRQAAKELLDAQRGERTRRGEEVASRTAALDQRRADIRGEIETLPGFGSKRRSRADGIYHRLRQLVLDLRREFATRIDAIADAERAQAELRTLAAAELRKIREFEARIGDDADAELIAAWSRDLDEVLSVATECVRMEQSFRDDVLERLRQAKEERRGFADEVSDEALAKDRRYLLQDLGSELRLVRPIVEGRGRRLLRTLTDLGSHRSDWSFVSSLFFVTLKLLAVVVLWWWTRRRVPPLAPLLLQLWAARTVRYHVRDLRGMEPSLRGAGVAALDLTAGALALDLVPEALRELGLVLLVVLLLALYRLLLGAAELLVATHPELRPAWVTLRPEPRKLLLRALHYGVLWLMGFWLTRYLALVLLAAVALDEVLRLFFTAAAVALAVWVFHASEPHLRAVMRRRDPGHKVGRWLAREHLGILRSLQGFSSALLLLLMWTWELLGERGQRLWVQLVAQLRRPSAQGEEEGVPAELPGEVMRSLATRECSDECYIPRSAAEAQLQAAYDRFTAERSAEMVLVVGDQGVGKHTLVERFGRTWEAAGATLLRPRLGVRLTHAEDARDWLAETFEVDEPPSSPEALAGRLSDKLAEHVVLVEDLHRAFLRRVDGFGALRYLLSVLGTVQGPVFVLATMHRPAWKYLCSLQGLVNAEVFRRVVEIAPFDEEELRRLLLERLETAGHEVSFVPLLAEGVRSRSALERVTAEYFRRLLWASEGNPSVALALWRASLATRPRTTALVVTAFVSEGAAPELRDDELFVLAAIYTHRSLTEEEVVEVTNMNGSTVRAAIKKLDARRLLSTRSKRFSFASRHLYSIRRTLRRRHIVHGSS